MKVCGIVAGGNKLGRQLGFPTANISVGDALTAADGVYAARVELDGRRYDAMAYLGKKPSVDGGRRVLEAHIFDFSDDIYDRPITIELLDFVRPERRFASFDELKQQLALDKQCISTKLSNTK